MEVGGLVLSPLEDVDGSPCFLKDREEGERGWGLGSFQSLLDVFFNIIKDLLVVLGLSLLVGRLVAPWAICWLLEARGLALGMGWETPSLCTPSDPPTFFALSG